jgi:hypothetical protein
VIALRCLVPLALLAALACDRPNDQPRLQAELVATARDYDSRLDELKLRGEAIDRRRLALPHDTLNSAAAEHSLGHARTVIEDQRGYLRTVRARLRDLRPGALAETRALLDELRHRLDDGVTEATAELAAVESWVAIAEQQQRPGAPPPEPPPEPARPAGADRARETDASGTPIR